MDVIEGIVEKVFRSIPYRFGAFLLEQKDASVSRCVGKSIPKVVEQERVRLEGEWEEDPKYGKGFRIKKLTVLKPRTKGETLAVLKNGLFPSATPYAEQLVNALGTKAFDTFAAGADKLNCKAISIEDARSICAEYDMMVFFADDIQVLAKYHVSAERAITFVRHYGHTNLNDSIFKKNPYKLMAPIDYDEEGLSFRQCDAMANDIGIKDDDYKRISGAIFHVLKSAAAEGDIYLTPEDVEKRLFSFLKLNQSERVVHRYAQCLKSLIQDRELMFDEFRNRIYILAYKEAEDAIAHKITHMEKPSWMRPTSVSTIRMLEEDMGIRFSSEQKSFLLGFHRHPCQVLTGGPGVGKTTLLKAVVELLTIMSSGKATIHCAAPTGRAAKILSMATGIEARTMHSELLRKDSVPDVLILDEMSMAPLLVFSELVARTPAKMILLVGDANQLPAVGPGDVLRDIIRSRSIPVFTLKTRYRQDEESSIISNSYRILEGDKKLESDTASFFFSVPREATVKYTVDRFMRAITKYDVMDVQVLVPMKRTDVSTSVLNSAIQKAIREKNHVTESYHAGDRVFYIGDKVMETRNDRLSGAVNGDIGIVTGIEDGKMIVRFGATERATYGSSLVLAWAITVHKAQGGEFDVVFYVADLSHERLLKRNLLYTAMTRAKTLFISIGDPRAIALAIDTPETRARRTTLTEQLKIEAAG